MEFNADLAQDNNLKGGIQTVTLGKVEAVEAKEWYILNMTLAGKVEEREAESTIGIFTAGDTDPDWKVKGYHASIGHILLSFISSEEVSAIFKASNTNKELADNTVVELQNHIGKEIDVKLVYSKKGKLIFPNKVNFISSEFKSLLLEQGPKDFFTAADAVTQGGNVKPDNTDF